MKLTDIRRKRIIDLLVGYEVDILWYRRDDAQNRESYEFAYFDSLSQKTDEELKDLLTRQQVDEKLDKQLLKGKL